MPARSNEFQDLVALIQQTYAPHGARITESAIVDVPGLEGGREIDILIEGQFGPYGIKIAVEAKDETRKMDLTKFEAIVGKYHGVGSISVSKVVIVTRKGYFANVKKKASMLNIELVTLSEAKDFDWAKLTAGTVKYEAAPHLCRIGFEPAITDYGPDLILEGQMICKCGDNHGNVNQFAHHILNCHVLPERPTFVQEVVDKAIEYNGDGWGTVKYPIPHFTVEMRGKKHSPDFLIITMHAVHQTSQSQCRSLRLESTSSGTKEIFYTFGEINGMKLEMMHDFLANKLAVRISKAKAEKQKSAKRKKRKQ